MKKITYNAPLGRVSGLFPAPGVNLLWENPCPWDGKGWNNPGGDRVWISPEAELFFTEPSKGWSSYRVPASVDPGQWVLQENKDGSAEFRNRGECFCYSAGEKFSFELRQTIIPAETPGFDIPEGLAFAGYTKLVTLQVGGTFKNGKYPMIWNLLQVSPGGRIYVPDTEPCSYFGKPQWFRQQGCLVMPVPAPEVSCKLGITSEKSRGIMVYIKDCGRDAALVFRSFMPAEKCFDMPWGGGICCPQQLFADDGSSGGFGEMEHHSEPVDPGNGCTGDKSFTGAFSGRKEACFELLSTFIRKGLDL